MFSHNQVRLHERNHRNVETHPIRGGIYPWGHHGTTSETVRGLQIVWVAGRSPSTWTRSNHGDSISALDWFSHPSRIQKTKIFSLRPYAQPPKTSTQVYGTFTQHQRVTPGRFRASATKQDIRYPDSHVHWQLVLLIQIAKITQLCYSDLLVLRTPRNTATSPGRSIVAGHPLRHSRSTIMLAWQVNWETIGTIDDGNGPTKIRQKMPDLTHSFHHLQAKLYPKPQIRICAVWCTKVGSKVPISCRLFGPVDT